ncbi:MAG: PfkB family carbohydrate kinase [bacterium]
MTAEMVSRPTTHDPRPTVVVFGGCNLDVIARSNRFLRPGVSNPGAVSVTAGGAGRNVAANLARLGVTTDLISGVGADPAGDYLIAETARAGVRVAGIARTADRSNYYVAIAGVGPDVLAVSDMAATEALTPAQVHEAAGLTRHARMVVIDANLDERSIAAAIDAAGSTAICLLPTSPAKAGRVAGVLNRAVLIAAGLAELEVLAGRPITSAGEAQDAAEALRRRTGADVLVSMGTSGIGIAADETHWLDALPVAVVDPTGAGDAAAATAIFGRISGLSTRELLALARAAGTMTVTVRGATHPGLTLEALRAYG